MAKSREMVYVDSSLGKVPPQALDLEESLLGALLISTNTHELIPEIRFEMFYSDSNQEIFKAINDLYNSHIPIDMLTVVDKLRKNGMLDMVGGPYQITTLTNKALSGANAEYWLRIIEQKYLQRQLIQTSMVIQKQAYDDTVDVFELVEKAEQLLFQSKETLGVNAVIKHISDISTEIAMQEKARPSLMTGCNQIDSYLPHSAGDLTFIAARPSQGKTAFAMWEARKIAEMGSPVAYFSFEMFARVLVSRMATASGIPFYFINNGLVDAENYKRLTRELSELAGLDFYFIDDRSLSMRDIMGTARRLVKKNGVKKIYIDQLSLVNVPEYKDEYPRTTHVCKMAKIMAGELDVPVTVVAQIGRSAEHRGGDMKPRMTDLKGTGGIEEAADNICMMWRPEAFVNQNDEKMKRILNLDGREISSKGYVELAWAKVRNGPPGRECMTFEPETYSFTNWKEKQYEKKDETLTW